MVELPEQSVFAYTSKVGYLSRTGTVISLAGKQLGCRLDKLFGPH
jgi:hypothetical protein